MTTMQRTSPFDTSPTAMLSPDVQQAASRSVLCWLATVDASGQPNVSPKEVFAVFDAQHIVVAHIASPTTVRNLQQASKVCLSFIDVFVQKGYKVAGHARYVARAHPEFAHWAQALVAMAEPRFTVHGVIVVQAQAVEPIVAPSYRLYPAETTEASQIASALKTYGVQRADP
jgi:predicted pyridoxine 5'-phosphate oxidase superfamily flavin-nucleotide-binding protein